MRQFSCPACLAVVALDEASEARKGYCPKCGAEVRWAKPIRLRSRWDRLGFWPKLALVTATAVVASALILTVWFVTHGRAARRPDDLPAGAAGPGLKPQTTERPPLDYVVTVQEIGQLYQQNEAAGDDQYAGRRVTCKGVLHRVEKLSDGSYLMSFDYFVDGFNMRRGIVDGYFPAAEAERLKAFSYRQEVLFTGRCDGFDAKVRAVAIRDCRIAPPAAGR